MSDIFYLFGFLFIVMEMIHISGKKKIIAEGSEAKQMMEDSFLYGTLEVVIEFMKKKGIKIVFGFFYMGWQIVGIFSTPERKYFIPHFVLGWVFAYLPFFTKDDRKKYEIEVVGVIISVAIIVWILYSHFFLT